ncbi:unnamed protein product [Heterobilharzia americana]|nr:unnamed protein product [Heterobilharzia americana]
MDTVLLSDLERFYLVQGVEVGCRMDGRGPSEYRPLEIETNILSHASGSASIRIGETFIVCCVKMEVGKPSLTSLNEGRVEINVECYPTATHRCNEKGASELAERLKTTLQSVYKSELLDLTSLCIQRGRQCWIVYIDLLILEGAGNLLDASSLVIKAALLNATQNDFSGCLCNESHYRALNQYSCFVNADYSTEKKCMFGRMICNWVSRQNGNSLHAYEVQK